MPLLPDQLGLGAAYLPLGEIEAAALVWRLVADVGDRQHPVSPDDRERFRFDETVRVLSGHSVGS